MVFDKSGNEIRKGSYIVYGTAAYGTGSKLRIGKVIRIKAFVEDDKRRSGHRLLVRGIDDVYPGVKARLMDRRSTIYDPSQVLVIREDQVSEHYRFLLSKEKKSR